jgi:hypothetical protein
METRIFHHAKHIIFAKKSSERNQNPSRYYNSITKSQVSTQAKISFFQTSSFQNRAIIIIYLLGAYKNPLSYYTL